MIRLRIHQSPRDALQMMTRPDERLERTDFIISLDLPASQASVLNRGARNQNTDVYSREIESEAGKEGTT